MLRVVVKHVLSNVLANLYAVEASLENKKTYFYRVDT